MYDPNDENSQVAMGFIIMGMVFCFGWVMRGFF